MYPYKPKLVQELTLIHKTARLDFCHWILNQGENFPSRVMWSDEKLWFEKIRPNKQNERYWAESDPEIEVDCKQQGGKSVMCWAALIDGKVLLHVATIGSKHKPRHLFECFKNDNVAKSEEYCIEERLLVPTGWIQPSQCKSR